MVTILLLFVFIQASFAQPLKKMIFRSPFPYKNFPINKDSAAVMQLLHDSQLYGKGRLLYMQGNNKQPESGVTFNALTEKLPMPLYKGNNGAGFDIYESTVDNMPLLVPDKTNPIIKPNTLKLENFYRVPEQTPGSQIYKIPQLVKPL